MKNELEKATFGMGCFWHSEEMFRSRKGVKKVSVGFMGGDMENPTYEDVSYKDTKHVEVVHMTFDPEVISYKKLLEYFFEGHDPTQLNRQGADVGVQYRTVIFYHSKEQKKLAEVAKKEHNASDKHKEPVVTAIEEAGEYYKAEEYHQRYLDKRGLDTCPS